MSRRHWEYTLSGFINVNHSCYIMYGLQTKRKSCLVSEIVRCSNMNSTLAKLNPGSIMSVISKLRFDVNENPMQNPMQIHTIDGRHLTDDADCFSLLTAAGKMRN